MAGSFFVAAFVLSLSLPDTFKQRRSITKFETLAKSQTLHRNDSERRDIWRFSIAQVKRGDAILFGVGPRNFKSIDPADFRFDPPLVRFNPTHAHNLFLTKYIEEGILGVAAILFLFFVVVRELYLEIGGRIRFETGDGLELLGQLLFRSLRGHSVLLGIRSTPYWR